MTEHGQNSMQLLNKISSNKKSSNNILLEPLLLFKKIISQKFIN